jgi:DNA-directed RNA polymerase specialized sigma24 family protein
MLAERAIVEAVRGAVADETGQSDPIDSVAKSDDGRLGPGSGDAGQLLEACRQYLLMIANDVIGPELQAKLGPSDLVQDTFLEAQRHIDAFRGQTRGELRA